MVRRTLMAAILAACTLLSGGLPASAAEEFSADMTTTASGMTTTAKLYKNGPLMRIDMPEASIIYRPDKDVMWMLQPQMNAYFEMPLDRTAVPETSRSMQGEVSRKPLGRETIAGYETQKYEVAVRGADGRTLRFHQWMATKLGFPVRTVALDGSMTTDFRNIVPSAPLSLFSPPPGYSKMAMPGGMGR